ncbi:MAG: UDP-N-acetylmuramate--L-alanine ligase [Acidimicrobiales bacterium]
MTPAAEQAVDLSVPQRIHVVGAGGAGMSAIATVLAAMGHEVTGSDLKPSPMFLRLENAGLRVTVGHDPANVAGAGALAISSAIPAGNPEIAEARRLGIPVYSRADVLTGIAALRRVIAVAGTHGKTTTSSMLSLILVEAGLKPSFIIGGDLNEIGTNAVWDTGEWLVVEADESDRTFLRLSPEIAVVMSVEPDHLETYGSFTALQEAFAQFLDASQRAVVSGDDAAAAALAAALPPGKAVTFGLGAATHQVGDIAVGRGSVAYSLSGPGGDLGRFEVAVPGEHNALNAVAATLAASAAGAGVEVSRRALARFAGVARRFEFRGERNGVTFVDDYAHLPSEVRSVLRAARAGGYSRVVCVFQPHRYSRMASLAPSFADAFLDAAVVVVTEIYSSDEMPRPGVSGRLVVDAVKAAHPEADVRFAATHEELLATLRSTLIPGDCCISLEAGDLTGLPDELLQDDSW